jgi:hypothetical protein
MQRKVFLAASAAAAVAVAACENGRATELELVESAAHFEPAAFQSLAKKSADVRQLWDVSGYDPHVLGSIKNALNGYQFGFGIKPAGIATALCLHDDGNAFAYGDAVWQKYNLGQALQAKDPTGNAVRTNVFVSTRSPNDPSADPNDPKSMYQDATIEALQRRGTAVLVCHTAAAEQSRDFVQRGIAPPGMSAQAVLADLLAHVIPGSIVVPSMVAAIGLMQSRYGYAYTSG